MTASEFMARMHELHVSKDRAGVLRFYDECYEAVKADLTDEERDLVRGGYCHLAESVLEGQRRHALAEADERELAPAA